MNVIDVLAILPYYVSLFLMEPEVMPDPSEVSYIAATTSTTSTTINPLLDEPEEGGASFDDVRRIIQVNKTNSWNTFFSSPILLSTCNNIFSKTILGVPDHENYENFQIGPSFHRPSIYCLYLEKQLQGTGSSNVVFGHGRPYIFLTMLFRGKRRGGHCFFFHSGIILVGYYYYDHCGVWWYFAYNRSRQNSR